MSIDATTALRPDVYRVTTIVLVPGFVAVAPWLAGVLWPELLDANTWSRAALPVSVTIFGIVLVAGFVLENIGSRIEGMYLDLWLKKKAPRLFAYWWRYLGLKTGDEVVGQRYLRALLLRFKFELSMISASLISCTGFLYAVHIGHFGTWAQWVALIVFALAIFFWFEAVAGSVVLARTRRIVVRACK